MFLEIVFEHKIHQMPELRIYQRNTPTGQCIVWPDHILLKGVYIRDAIRIWENRYGRIPTGIYITISVFYASGLLAKGTWWTHHACADYNMRERNSWMRQSSYKPATRRPAHNMLVPAL